MEKEDEAAAMVEEDDAADFDADEAADFGAGENEEPGQEEPGLSETGNAEQLQATKGKAEMADTDVDWAEGEKIENHGVPAEVAPNYLRAYLAKSCPRNEDNKNFTDEEIMISESKGTVEY